MSRTNNAAKNIFFGVLSNIKGLLLNFISRTIFIHFLGNTFLGIGGLFSSILSVLSLTELGFGSALTFAMYRPVANNDREQILKLLDFFKTVHRIVALTVAILGLSIVPFLQYIVKGTNDLSLSELRLYFLIFLANSVTSYFVSYQYCYLNALQKSYIVTNIEMVTSICLTVIQIIIMIATRNYLTYLLTQTLGTILSKIIINAYLVKKYPLLKERPQKKMTRAEKAPIYKEVKDLMVHNFSSVAVHSTDNIIIASLNGLGIVMVGLVSNYNLIITSVLAFASILFNSLVPGFGNLVAQNDTRNYLRVFAISNFVNFWVYGFCAIAFFVLIPPFIILWIGESYLIDTLCLFMIVLIQYLQGQCTIYNAARIAKGAFGQDKWNSLIQAIVNLIISVIAAKAWGLIGVYFGTLCCRVVILLRPIKTYPFLFGRSSTEYYQYFFKYLLITLLAGLITHLIVLPVIQTVTILNFLIAMVIVSIVPNLIFFLAFRSTEVFAEFSARAISFIKQGGKS